MIEEKKSGRAGYGSSRFIVRGPGHLELARAAALREYYNEYPSRFDFDPRFPQPGRRGGSRPKADQSALGGVGGAAGSVGGSGSEDLVVVPPPAFPRPRERGAGDFVLGSVPASSPESAQNCVPEGTNILRGQVVATVTVVVLVSQIIHRPFIVQHAVGIHSGGGNVDVAFQCKIAKDADTSGSTATSGVGLWGHYEGGRFVDSQSGLFEIYPNVRFETPPYFAKFIFNNQTAGNIDFTVAIDLLWLN